MLLLVPVKVLNEVFVDCKTYQKVESDNGVNDRHIEGQAAHQDHKERCVFKCEVQLWTNVKVAKVMLAKTFRLDFMSCRINCVWECVVKTKVLESSVMQSQKLYSHKVENCENQRSCCIV